MSDKTDVGQDRGGDVTAGELVQAVLPVWIHHIGLAVEVSQQAVSQLLTSFRNLESELRRQGVDMRPQAGSDLENIFMSLQYHDRLSQLLGLVSADASRLQELLQSPGGPPAGQLDPAAWLTRLQSQYAMAEQYGGDPAGAQGHGPDGGIEHF